MNKLYKCLMGVLLCLTMGWAGAVEMYRPFLSYSELGSMLDAGPSALYDALSAILGLTVRAAYSVDVRFCRNAARSATNALTSAMEGRDTGLPSGFGHGRGRDTARGEPVAPTGSGGGALTAGRA